MKILKFLMGNKEKEGESTIKSVFYALILALLFRSLFFDNFHVPSGSMIPTLLAGDKLTISKYQYGYSKYSFPFAFIPFKGRILDKKPQRGDIVVFKYPSNTRINYVKRLIGMPGEKIQVIDGLLYINNIPVERKRVQNFYNTETNEEVTQYLETLPNGVRYNTLDSENDSWADNTDEYIIPEDHYFFMGDNRDNSKDSRFSELGFVHRDYILGEVKLIFISSPNSLLNPLKWHKIRTNRILIKPQNHFETSEPV